MASRTNLITISFIDNDESEPIFHEGDLDVGISSDIEKYIEKYKAKPDEVDIKDKIFDAIFLEALGRFVRYYGTPEAREAYTKMKAIMLDEIAE